MDLGKVENLLNLSLNVSEPSLLEASELLAGYNAVSQIWELIFKFHGNIKQYETSLIRIEELLFGYGIVQIPESLIPFFSSLPEVEYIEKSKLLFFN